MSANAPQTGQIVPFKEKVNNLRGLLDKMQEQFAMALPSHVKVERLLRLTMSAVQREPKLLDCYQPTFLGALLECAQLGLEPNTSLGHAFLVPFRNRKMGGRLDCQVIPGYKGLIRLAYNSGQVSSIRAHVVREKDKFDYTLGGRPRLVHKPHRGPDAGDMVAVYSVADVKISDKPQFYVLERWECERIRDKFSAAANNGPWVTNLEEMSQKSAVRRNCKWLPADTEKSALARAVALDERAEEGIGQEFDNVIDIGVVDSVAVGEEGAAAAEATGDAKSEASATPTGGSKLDQLAAAKKAEREGKAG